jgi:hypothetical protein
MSLWLLVGRKTPVFLTISMAAPAVYTAHTVHNTVSRITNGRPCVGGLCCVIVRHGNRLDGREVCLCDSWLSGKYMFYSLLHCHNHPQGPQCGFLHREWSPRVLVGCVVRLFATETASVAAKCAFVARVRVQNTNFAHCFAVITTHNVHNAVSRITNGRPMCRWAVLCDCSPRKALWWS